MGRTKARKVISGVFSPEGLRSIKNQLHAYHMDVNKANEILVQKLMERGYEVASFNAYSAKGLDSDKPVGTLDISYDDKGMLTSMTLYFTGEQVLFVEFGAGIKYNENAKLSKNPFAKDMTPPMGVGTYPGQTHAMDKKGWSYMGQDGRWHHSLGTEATMPMYKASYTVRQELAIIAKEVFESVI